MAPSAIERTGRLKRLADFNMAGHAFLVSLVLVFGKRKIAGFRLVLRMAFGAVLLLAGGRKHHLRGRMPVMQGFIKRDRRARSFRRPGVATAALFAARAAFFAGLGRVVVTLETVVVINCLDFRIIRVFLTLELGRDRVPGHRVAGFALALDGLGVLVMLKPDHRIIEFAEFCERVDDNEIRAHLLCFDRFLFSPKSVQTESSHSHAYAQDSNPSQHWSSLLHVKIPLLKSAPENSENLPSPEAAPPISEI